MKVKGHFSRMSAIPTPARGEPQLVCCESDATLDKGLFGDSGALVTEIKPNIINIWPKINTLISSFNSFKGG